MEDGVYSEMAYCIITLLQLASSSKLLSSTQLNEIKSIESTANKLNS